MSTDIALQAMFDRFMGRFVLPLVSGRDKLLVSYPIGPGAEHYFEGAQELEPGLVSQIIQSRQQALASLIPNPSPEMLQSDEILLLISLHNTLLCAHEELVGGLRGNARWDHCVSWATAQLDRVPICRDPETALRRHSLLHLVPELSRSDTILKSRRGEKRYPGQYPPKHALVIPKFRKLSTYTTKVGLADMVATEESRNLFTQILERSPLTCLLSMPYGKLDEVHQQELYWSPEIVKVLTHPLLCRAVTYKHLDLGLHRVGPSLVSATLAGMKELEARSNKFAGQALAFGLRYIVNLHLTHIWTAAREDLMSPIEMKWFHETENLRGLFFGWFVAAVSRADRIGAPWPLDSDLRTREEHYRRAAEGIAVTHLKKASRHVDRIVPTDDPKYLKGGQS